MSYVYFARCPNSTIKIGFSANPHERLIMLLFRAKPTLLATIETPDGRALERVELARFPHLRVTRRGEYFHPGVDLLRHIYDVRLTHSLVEKPRVGGVPVATVDDIAALITGAEAA